MNHRVLLCLFILTLLSLHCVSAARPFTSTEPASTLSGINKDNAISKKGGSERNNDDNPWKLMGMEECKNGDEECEKRRLLSEAHLDYIYTQGHHKQP